MSDLARFQKQFGAQWSLLVGSREFAAAMTLLNVEKIRAIAELSDEEIATRGTIILADLRGHLKHENALLGLHEVKKFVFQNLPSEEYTDPAEEARLEAERQENGEAGEHDGDEEQQQQIPFPPPRPATPHREPPKKKKLPAKKKPRKIRAKR